MQCLSCHESLDRELKTIIHPKCSKRVFGTSTPPILPYTASQIMEHMDRMLIVEKSSDIECPNTLNFCDSGHFLITSNTSDVAYAELEAVTMLLAESAKIAVAPHTLLHSSDGSIHHLTRRVEIGRRGRILPMFNLKDLVIDSYEAVAEQIKMTSSTPKLDVINLYERLIYGYIVGINDMNLASFSIITSESGESTLAPMSRVTQRALIDGDDGLDMALTINGKRSDIYASDFESSMLSSGLERKIIENIFAKFERSLDVWCDIIDRSTLPVELKERCKFKIIIRYDMM